MIISIKAKHNKSENFRNVHIMCVCTEIMNTYELLNTSTVTHLSSIPINNKLSVFITPFPLCNPFSSTELHFKSSPHLHGMFIHCKLFVQFFIAE